MRETFAHEISSWVANLNRLEEEGRGTSPSFWKPFHLAMLATNARNRGVRLGIDNAHLDYAVRMRIFEAIGQDPPFEIRGNPAQNRFIEASAVTREDEVHETAYNAARLFRCENNETEDSIAALLSELLSNCWAHSEYDTEQSFGLICGQTWPQGDRAQVCIADSGIGIRRSLMENPDLLERLDAMNACELASTYGVTGKPHGRHSGYGLALASDLASYNDSQLCVVSGNELFLNKGGNKLSRRINSDWSGTAVVFEWRLSVALDVRQVYDSWPAPDGMDEEDYNELFD